MSSFRLRRPRATQNPAAKRKLMLIGVMVAVLCVALVVTTVFLIRSSQRMAAGRAQIEDAILSDLLMILRTYERFSEPRADIGGQFLPEISKHLYSAYTQDMVLIDLHGTGASILSNELYSNVNAAIETIDREIKADRIVNAADNALTPYIAQIQQILDARLDEGAQNSMVGMGLWHAA